MQGGVSARRSTLEFRICYRSSWSEWFHPDDSVREQGAATVRAGGRAGVGAAAGAGLRTAAPTSRVGAGGVSS